VTCSELAHLLDRFLTARKLPCASPDSDGAFTFDAGDGLAVCASTHKDGSLELVVNPGYLSASELEAVIEDDEDDADPEDDDVLMRWQASGAAWAVDADRDTGRVILSLSLTRAQALHDLDGFASVLGTMREAAAGWRALLAAAPPAMMRVQAGPGDLSYLAHLRI
jgi:hypothetical protein